MNQSLLQNGVAIAVLVSIGMFIWKAGWPFLVKTVEKTQAQNEKITAEFLIALERRDKGFEQIVSELQRITRVNGIVVQTLKKKKVL